MKTRTLSRRRFVGTAFAMAAAACVAGAGSAAAADAGLEIAQLAAAARTGSRSCSARASRCRCCDEGNNAARARLGLPVRYGSCHTARIGGYVVEGHVPVREIRRLLAEKPDAIGIAVPGMPVGSPGMDGPEYGGGATLSMCCWSTAMAAAAFRQATRPDKETLDEELDHRRALALAALAAQAQAYEGEVRKIEKAQGKITLRHGELKGLDMPPMTMVFRVSNPACSTTWPSATR